MNPNVVYPAGALLTAVVGMFVVGIYYNTGKRDIDEVPLGVLLASLAALLWPGVVPGLGLYYLGKWAAKREWKLPKFKRKNLEPVCPKCKTKGAYR